jgi:threonine-phosphate decarboxylase
MTTYQHGGDLKAFAKKAKCQEEDILDLSSNINFVKPKVTLDFDITQYPNYDDLYLSVARYFAVKSENIELYNGGSAAIFSFFRNCEAIRCVIYAPAYLEYITAASLFG